MATVSDNKDGYYNGQMKDNEWAGVGNYLDFGARGLDTRVGRFSYTPDPLAKKFPGQSVYVYAGDNPIMFIDKEGEFKLNPAIKKPYPMIYTYLSSQVEKDVMKSSLIKNAYKEINPKLTDANIRNVFQNNSGPQLSAIADPGGEFNAQGHTDYDQETSVITINLKIFNYVEKKLEGDESQKEKQVALMYLYTVVTHEAAHVLRGYGGTDESGHDIKMPDKQYEMLRPGESGYAFEQIVWKIPDMKDKYTNDLPPVIKGVESQSPKNKKGVMENVVKLANSTEEGKETLPTVPEKK